MVHRFRMAQLAVALTATTTPPTTGSPKSLIANPTADASAPGAALVAQVLGWLKWAGLASALAGLLIGAIAIGIGHFGSNYSASSAGRKWLLGGMGAAILSGLSWTIATTLYNATSR